MKPEKQYSDNDYSEKYIERQTNSLSDNPPIKEKIEKLGNTLADFRLKQLADEAGFTYRTLRRFLNGEVKLRSENYARLARATKKYWDKFCRNSEPLAIMLSDLMLIQLIDLGKTAANIYNRVVKLDMNITELSQKTEISHDDISWLLGPWKQKDSQWLRSIWMQNYEPFAKIDFEKGDSAYMYIPLSWASETYNGKRIPKFDHKRWLSIAVALKRKLPKMLVTNPEGEAFLKKEIARLEKILEYSWSEKRAAVIESKLRYATLKGISKERLVESERKMWEMRKKSLEYIRDNFKAIQAEFAYL